MARNDDEIQQIIDQALAGLGSTDIESLAGRLAFAGATSIEQLLAAATKPPVRRRPRRAEPVTLRVRVDLAGTKPPVWRRLELASDLFLDEVHEIMQAAFGWTDSHLHQFGCGPSYYSRETEYYLCPFSAGNGDEGTPEDEVRLDETLVGVGDKLFYAYDFGDDWQHTIRLEAVLAHEVSAARAICTGGRQPGPAEDCGGVGGYALLLAATDPGHPDHAVARAEYAELYGSDVDPHDWAPTQFDVDRINRVLAGLGSIASPHEITGPPGDLLDSMQTTYGQRQWRQLLGSARLDDPVLIGADTAAAAVRPYAWLLECVGDDGITLTQAGYLPPVHVKAAFTELKLDEAWIGAGNREDLTYPVLHLRQSARRVGLLRKHHGRLLVTTRGKALRSDPVGLWWHLAERTPVASTDRCVYHAGLLYLAALAAETTENPETVVAELLDALGWMRGDGSPITAQSAAAAASDVKHTLRRLGLLRRAGSGPDRWEQPTRNAVDFARAALTAWPP